MSSYFESLADAAIERGVCVEGDVDGHRVIAVPDVVAIEYAASGRSLPDAWGLRSAEGRTVRFFRVPEGVVVDV